MTTRKTKTLRRWKSLGKTTNISEQHDSLSFIQKDLRRKFRGRQSKIAESELSSGYDIASLGAKKGGGFFFRNLNNKLCGIKKIISSRFSLAFLMMRCGGKYSREDEKGFESCRELKLKLKKVCAHFSNVQIDKLCDEINTHNHYPSMTWKWNFINFFQCQTGHVKQA